MNVFENLTHENLDIIFSLMTEGTVVVLRQRQFEYILTLKDGVHYISNLEGVVVMTLKFEANEYTIYKFTSIVKTIFDYLYKKEK